MILICGLGNPGKKYENTRHNVGFKLIEKLVKDYNFKKEKKDKSKEIFKGTIEKKNIFLVKPLLFMNMSGSPISEIAKFYKIRNNNIFIIHDDLDFNLGKIKFKTGGGNGGHKGLISVDALIGKNYNRLRIGIGRPETKSLVNSYVLKKFNKDEQETIDMVLKSISKNLLFLLKKQYDYFFNKYHADFKNI